MNKNISYIAELIALLGLCACGAQVIDEGPKVYIPISSIGGSVSGGNGGAVSNVDEINPWTCSDINECIKIIATDNAGNEYKLSQKEANLIYITETKKLSEAIVKFDDSDLDINDYQLTISAIEKLAEGFLDDQSLAIERARNFTYFSSFANNFLKNYKNIEYKFTREDYSPPVIVISKTRLASSLGEEEAITQFDLVKVGEEWKYDLVGPLNPTEANPRIILFSLSADNLKISWEEIERLRVLISNMGKTQTEFKNWWDNSTLSEKQILLKDAIDRPITGEDIFGFYRDLFVNQIPDELNSLEGLHYAINENNHYLINVEYLIIKKDEKWVLDIKKIDNQNSGALKDQLPS